MLKFNVGRSIRVWQRIIVLSPTHIFVDHTQQTVTDLYQHMRIIKFRLVAFVNTRILYNAWTIIVLIFRRCDIFISVSIKVNYIYIIIHLWNHIGSNQNASKYLTKKFNQIKLIIQRKKMRKQVLTKTIDYVVFIFIVVRWFRSKGKSFIVNW